MLLFAKLADSVREREHIRFESGVLTGIHHLATPNLDRLAIIVTNAGSAEAVIAITLLVTGWLLYRRHRFDALLLVSGVGGASVANILLKLMFHRDRPSLWAPLITEHSYSFPSGHAMASSALGFCLIYLAWSNRWRWAVLLFASAYIIFVGISRLYLGVHYPSDVIAGWCVSFIWVSIVITILKRFTKQNA